MTAKKKAAPRNKRKTTAKSTGVVAKIPQPHGGALNAGGTPGNPGGGRPPSVVKQLASARLPKHIDTLDEIAQGRTYVALVEKCPKCGHEPEREVKLPQEAKPGERVRAVEALAKLADQKELVIASASAASFFDCVHQAITELYGAEAADQVKRRAMALVEASA